MSNPITLSPQHKMEEVESVAKVSREVPTQRVVDFLFSPEQEMKEAEFVRKVSRGVLMGLTSAEFVQLPAAERFKVYRQQLVKRNDYVQIDEDRSMYDMFNPEIAKGEPLRIAYYMGDDAAGQQIVKEAREVYYKENKFLVPSHWLGEFLVDHHCYHNGPLKVDGLVRHITVTISVEIDEESTLDGKEQQETETVRDLRQLLQLKEADFIEIYVNDARSMDGSDIKTRKKMKEIFPVVQELIEVFQEQFSIHIVHKKPGQQQTYHKVTPYFGGME